MENSMRGILDARILMMDKFSSDEEYYLFEDVLAIIASNKDIVLSKGSLEWLMLKYEELGFPEGNCNIPGGVRKSIIKNINAIQYRNNIELSGNQVIERFIDKTTCKSGRYPDYEDELCKILSSYFEWKYFFILSSDEFWGVSQAVIDPVRFYPPTVFFKESLNQTSIDNLIIEFDVDKLNSAIEKVRYKEPLIFGGKKDDSIIEILAIFCGVSKKSIVWIEAEKNKQSKNIQSAYKGLDPDKNLAILYSGRVGHSESTPYKNHCKENGILFVFSDRIESICKDIVDQLSRMQV